MPVTDALTTQMLLDRCLTLHPDVPVVSKIIAGKDEQGQPIPMTHRTTLGEATRRATKLAGAMMAAGVQQGDRVASLAVNSFYHLEAYLGVSSMGAVMHTLNIRLLPEQIIWIINDAEDKVLLIDPMFLSMLPAIKANCPTIEKVIVFGPAAVAPGGTQDYESFIADFPEQMQWPELDENLDAMLCYTSGTTGNPKGVLYTHRSMIIHSLAAGHKTVFGVGPGDVILPIVPMFHANAWGTIHVAAMYGCGLVFTGVFNDGPTVASLLQDEKVTFCAGVVTVMNTLLAELERAEKAGTPYDISSLELIGCGGTAVPEAMMRTFDKLYNVRLMQAWGMTETGPLGTTSHAPVGVDPCSDLGYEHRARHGRPAPLVEISLIDDEGQPVPHDGKSMGRLLVRGPWVIKSYFKRGVTDDFVQHRGKTWLDSGDIATIAPDGELWLQDRAKDLVKSGGEWIPSAELETELMGHPQVSAAVVIAVPHEKWMERPLALIIPKGDSAPDSVALREHLTGRVAKWWIPDDFVVVQDLPIGATGKYLKREIRDQYKDHVWSNPNGGEA